MSAEVVRFDFHGDALEVVRNERGVWVALKRVCESIGVDVDGQRRKLADKSWAVTEMISATAADGKNYKMLGVHLDSLPMWLATIEPSKVAEEVRPTLELYQRDAARVLRDHFIGKPSSRPSEATDIEVARERRQLAREQRLFRKQQLELLSRYGAVLRKAGHEKHAERVEMREMGAMLGDDPRPLLEARAAVPEFSAEQLAAELGESASTIGRFATALELKTQANQEREAVRLVSNHAPGHPTKQVDQWLYRTEAADLIRHAVRYRQTINHGLPQSKRITIPQACATVLAKAADAA